MVCRQVYNPIFLVLHHHHVINHITEITASTLFGTNFWKVTHFSERSFEKNTFFGTKQAITPFLPSLQTFFTDPLSPENQYFIICCTFLSDAAKPSGENRHERRAS